MPDDPAILAGMLVVLLLSLCWHEAAHAWVADRLGDPTARELGRVTMNPIRHMDLWLSVVLPGLILWISKGTMVFGGGKPVPINPGNFRKPTRDFMLVALAGPGSNLLLALGFSLLYAGSVWLDVLPPDRVPTMAGVELMPPRLLDILDSDAGSVAEEWLRYGVLINVLLAVFNMLPLPPLDGSRVIGWMLPRKLQGRWYRLDRIGLVMVLVFIFMLDGMKYVSFAAVGLFILFAGLADWLTMNKVYA